MTKSMLKLVKRLVPKTTKTIENEEVILNHKCSKLLNDLFERCIVQMVEISATGSRDVTLESDFTILVNGQLLTACIKK